MDHRWGKIHFWAMFVFFNLTFFPLFIVGLLGQPRRVFEYASNLQVWNDFSSVNAFLSGGVVPDLRRQLPLDHNHQPAALTCQPMGVPWARVADRDARYRSTISSGFPSSSTTRTTTAKPEPVAMADLDGGLAGAGITHGTAQPPRTLDPGLRCERPHPGPSYASSG